MLRGTGDSIVDFDWSSKCDFFPLAIGFPGILKMLHDVEVFSTLTPWP